MSQVIASGSLHGRGPTINPMEFRDALGQFATGIAVVTTIGAGGAPVGLTISSFNSVSINPPLILWSLAVEAPSRRAFHAHGAFAINILAENQIDICRQFAAPSDKKFDGVPFRWGYASVPLIDGAAAQFECRTYARYPGGDHEIYVGEVCSLSSCERPPLVFHRGEFKVVEDLRG